MVDRKIKEQAIELSKRIFLLPIKQREKELEAALADAYLQGTFAADDNLIEMFEEVLCEREESLNRLRLLEAVAEAARDMITVCLFPCGDQNKCGNCHALDTALASLGKG